MSGLINIPYEIPDPNDAEKEKVKIEKGFYEEISTVSKKLARTLLGLPDVDIDFKIDNTPKLALSGKRNIKKLRNRMVKHMEAYPLLKHGFVVEFNGDTSNKIFIVRPCHKDEDNDIKINGIDYRIIKKTLKIDPKDEIKERTKLELKEEIKYPTTDKLPEKIESDLDTPQTDPNTGIDTEYYKEEVIKTFEDREARDEVIAYFAESLGAELHEEWRKDYAAKQENIDENGRVKPRIKDTTDEEWIKTHGTDKVDIYYTPFKDLPSDKKKDNLEAAKEAIDLVFDRVTSGEEITQERIEEMSSIVHENRMKRNSWEKDNRPELFVPYSELPEDEKVKDRKHILQAIAKIKAGK